MGRVLAGVLAILFAFAAAAPAAGAEPTISVVGDSVTEGDPDQPEAYFAVWLSEPSADPVVVDYATRDDTALAPEDYAASTGQLTIPAGETLVFVAVPVNDDALNEADESFALELSNASGATIDTALDTSEILDDDPVPSVSIADAASPDGSLRFTITLSAPSGRAVSVVAKTSDGTARATADYRSAWATVSFGPGDTSEDFVVQRGFQSPMPAPAHGPADPRFFYVDLSNPMDASIARGRATGTLSWTGPSVFAWASVADARVREGRAAAVPLTGSTGSTLAYRTVQGTARRGSDFAPVAGIAGIGPGATIRVATRPDSLREPAETFQVAISGFYDMRLVRSVATVTIVDDPPPRLARLRIIAATPSTAIARFELSERAAVLFRLQRRAGRRWVGTGARLRRAGRPGSNRARLRRLRLAPGLYRLVAVAVGRPGRRSMPRHARFRVEG